MLSVHNFSNGLLNPALGYVISCVGCYLGLRCVIMARPYHGVARARWLSLAAVSIGATGIWAMHFIAMLGFTVPGHEIRYSVPMTLASMLVAIAVAGIGLFIVGFGDGGWRRLLAGGVIIGLGVAVMHYLGMAAMSMQGSMSYNIPLVALSLLVAIVAGTAALWAGTQVNSTGVTIGAALIMGAAVSGMHYTGMAALHVVRDPMSMAVGTAAGSAAGSMASGSTVSGTTVSGTAAAAFLIPLLLVISIATFAVTLTISMSPDADEIEADAELQRRLEHLERRQAWSQVPSGPDCTPPWSVPDDRF